MRPEAAALWDRALKGLRAAKALLSIDPDGAASRAYYAAFYAVSALFALEGRTFRKHSGVAAAVHKDLVKAGRWPAEIGEAYSWLLRTRHTGDYGQDVRVKPAEASEAVGKAAQIIEMVRQGGAGAFP